MNKPIPNSWTYTELDELLLYVIGGDWGKDPSFNFNDYSLAYCIRGSEYRNWDKDKGRTASLRKIKNSNLKARQLQEGDILVEISGGGPEQPVGRTVLIDKSVLAFESEIPKIHTNFLRLIRPSVFVNSKYLNYCLINYYNTGEVVKIQAGSNNLRNLKFPDYLKVNIALAPLNEQNRIVDKLDELLSELEIGKEQLQNSLEQLKVYRQSILKHAFEGELTAIQRKKKQFGDTKELLKQLREKGKEFKIKLKYPKINDDEELPTIPKEWQWIRNEELLKYVTSGSRDWKQYYSDSGSIFIRTQDIKSNNLSLENAAYVKLPAKAEGKRSLVELNDLLMTITGANVGKVALIEKEIPEAYVSQSVALMKYLDSRLTKYMWYYFQSRAFGQGLINNLVYGVGRPVLSLENMKEVPVALCSIQEQQSIVNEIENKFLVCDKMEAEILQALNQIEPLKQGLLQKAFEGKLVEQDPTDEPASVLLERIKKEREEFLKAEKKRKKAEKPLYIKTRKMAEELKRILEILKESKEPVSAKTLWQSSTHKDDIDEFYAALKKHIEAGEIIELPRKGKESFLKLAEAK